MAGTGAGADNADALLEAIIGSEELAVVSVSPQGTVTSWSATAERLLGWPAELIVGADVNCLRPAPGASSPLRAPLDGSTPYSEETLLRRDGSEVAVAVITARMRAQPGQPGGAALLLRDISSRVADDVGAEALRRELEVRNRLLERSNDDLEHFASVASHDLSEPLRAVAGMVSLLQRRYRGRLDADADEFIDFAVDGCERMRATIEDLLAYSRIGRSELRPVPVGLAGLLDEVEGMLGEQIGASSAAIGRGQLPVVTADPAQLRRVLQHLLSNAIKFARPAHHPQITVEGVAVDGGWRITVADDGIGIEPAYREQVFGMFRRLNSREDYAGTGIGLTVCQRIVERHGGVMGIDGNEAGGTTIWFTLPSAPARGDTVLHG